MEKKFVIGRDGFVEYERPYALEKAARVWKDTIKNKYLYQYDVSVYELNENNTIKRRVDFQELQALTS